MTTGTRGANGRSSIYQDKNGGWHGRVTMGRKPDGAVDRRHVRAPSQSKVTKKVRELERQRDNGEYAQVHQMRTVEQWLRHWVETTDVRAKSKAAYGTAVYKHLIPGIGKHPLKDLRVATVEAFYKSMYDTLVEDKSGVMVRKYRPATVHQVHRTLRTALGDAVKKQYLGINPAAGATIPNDQFADAADTEVVPFTVSEARSIITAANKRRGGIRFIIALSYGLRQGECLGLKWDPHVNLEDAMAKISVREQLQRHTWQHGCDTNQDGTHVCGRKRGCDCPRRHGGGLKQTTVKSKSGKRDLRLDPIATEALRKHKREQSRERLTAGEKWESRGHVFTQANGQPIDPRMDYEEWQLLLQEAGVREARLHDARHTAATILLVQGVSDRTVMELLGWSSVAMLKRYQHVIEELRSDAAAKVGSWLYGDTTSTGGESPTDTMETDAETPGQTA